MRKGSVVHAAAQDFCGGGEDRAGVLEEVRGLMGNEKKASVKDTGGAVKNFERRGAEPFAAFGVIEDKRDGDAERCAGEQIGGRMNAHVEPRKTDDDRG